MNNNKGFSLVELLAVFVILGLLFGIGVQTYSRYREKAKKEGYDIMAKSASQAAEQYKMDHPSATEIDIKRLHDEGYLSSIKDPGTKGSDCSGKVRISTIDDDPSKIEENNFTVSICCVNYNYLYTFPGGNKVKNSDDCTD